MTYPVVPPFYPYSERIEERQIGKPIQDKVMDFKTLFLILLLLDENSSTGFYGLGRILWITLFSIPLLVFGILGMWIPTIISVCLLFYASVAGAVRAPFSFTKLIARMIWVVMSAILMMIALCGLYPMLLVWCIITAFHIAYYEII